MHNAQRFPPDWEEGKLYLRMQDTSLRMRRVEHVVTETPRIKTFHFYDTLPAKPGQFIMVWIPDVDEIPMSLSYVNDIKGFTVQLVGEATEALHKVEVGDYLGIRGPFGRSFEIDQCNSILAIAGGCGIAPLAPVIEAAQANKINISLLIGVRSETDLFFQSRFQSIGLELELYSEDGSIGQKGLVTQDLPEILSSGAYDLVLSCGPELMLKTVVDITRDAGVEAQIAVERYMKCGLGICDSCSIDGFQVCRDGPIFKGSELGANREFGKFRRDAAGIEIDIREQA